jgi:DNA/RNA endonuclease G (NUC1)
MRFRALRTAGAAALTVAAASCADHTLVGPTPNAPALRASAAAAAATPTLVITEVMADPQAVADAAGEWFEVHNPGSEPVDLEGWTIGSNNDQPHVIETSVVVPAGGYVVLGTNANRATNGGVPVNYAYAGATTIALANGSDWIELSGPTGAAGRVTWTATATAGASRALGNPACDNHVVNGAAWTTSTTAWTGSAGDRGTPGVENGAPTACPVPPPPLPRDVYVTEVMADPSAVADGSGEWIEVHNPGDAPIDLQGWTLGSRNDADHVINAALVIPAGGYVVLGNNGNAATNGNVVVHHAYRSSLTLANTSDHVRLQRTVGGTLHTIDSVAWNTGPTAGRSRALVDPQSRTGADVGSDAWVNGSTRWPGSPGDLGSPGTANPVPQPGVSVLVNDPARLPVGYTKPAFPTVRDARGNVVSPTPALTWSSADEGIATVDARGYITGVAAGTVRIRATTADGVTGSTTLTILDADAPTTAVYRNHVEFGVPVRAGAAGDPVIRKRGFALSYSAVRGGPNWVSWNINATHFGAQDRCNCFSADGQLPGDVYKVVDFDYRNGGYDRGHLVQSFSRTTTEQENAATFLLTNILPQAAENNQGPWSYFESYLNERARQGGKEIYVIAGGQYAAAPPTLKGEGRVQIPDYTWKVAVVMDGGRGLADVRTVDDLEVIAVRMPNLITGNGPASAVGIRPNAWETYRTTVRAIEGATGYDLLDLLPDHVEAVVETGTRAPIARLAAPATAAEGAPVQFDASASSDPDGDAIAFAWTFGDGSTATGATPTHSYADNGTYTATVRVTDSHGAYTTATATVTVANVAPTVAPFAGATLLQGERYASSGTFADPGADHWTATVSYGDGSATQPLALAGTSFTLGHRYDAAGTHLVTVAVADQDGDRGTRTATVVVSTPQQGTRSLIASVDALVRTRQLSAGNGNALTALLRAAITQLDAGNTADASDQMRAFIRQVDGLVRGGQLAAAAGERLAGEAERILRSINR